MKIKDIIWEQQLPTDQNNSLLKRALELGCFSELKLDIDPTPIKNKNSVSVLKATGTSTGKIYHIFAQPQRIVEVTNESNFYEWECPSLTNKEERVKSDIEKLRKSREEQSGTDCINTFKELYSNYVAVKKGGASLDTNIVKRLRDNAQACLIEPETKRKLFAAKLPLINQKFEKIYNELKNINPADTRLKFFRIVESDNLSRLIKQTLKEQKEKKENNKIQKQIFESRMQVVFEGIDKFNSLPVNKKVKTAFKTLREINEIRNMGVLNESLGSLFKGLYGKTYESSIGAISEPLFNVIFTKISLDDELKSQVMENLQSNTNQLIQSMESCLDLSKFLSDVITEEYSKKLDKEKELGVDIVKSSLMDAVNEELFKKNLQTKLEIEVCKLYEKFTENAKNLMVRMSAL